MAEQQDWSPQPTDLSRIIPAWRADTSGCSKCHGEEEARND